MSKKPDQSMFSVGNREFAEMEVNLIRSFPFRDDSNALALGDKLRELILHCHLMGVREPEASGQLGGSAPAQGCHPLAELAKLIEITGREKGKARMWVLMTTRNVLNDLKSMIKSLRDVASKTKLHPVDEERLQRDFGSLLSRLASCDKDLVSLEVPLRWVITQIEPLIECSIQESRQEDDRLSEHSKSLEDRVSVRIRCKARCLGFAASEMTPDQTDPLQENASGLLKLEDRESTSELTLDPSHPVQKVVDLLLSQARLAEWVPAELLEVWNRKKGEQGDGSVFGDVSTLPLQGSRLCMH